MNKTYKTFFNRARGMTVVASEVASAVRKGARKAAAVTLLGTQAVTMTLGGMGMPVAHAATYNVVGGEVGDYDDNIAIGNGSNAENASVVVGVNATGIFNSVVIGGGAKALMGSPSVISMEDDPSVITDGAVVVGVNATVEYASVGIGYAVKSTGESAVAIGEYARTSGSGSVALGAGANASAKYSSTAVGYAAEALGNYSTALGGSAQASANYSVALGYQAKASAEGSVALGYWTVANVSKAMAVGEQARAYAERSMAFGYGAKANKNASNSIALGSNATANASNATALGYLAKAEANRSIALGNNATANTGAYDSIVLGTDAIANGSYATALGYGASASASESIALGNGASTTGSSASVALGSGAYASGMAAVALGSGSHVSGVNAVALGTGAAADSKDAVALGPGANAALAGGVALGSSSKTERNANETGISYTSGSWSTSSQSNATWKATRAAVSVGDVGSNSTQQITRQITGVAAGSQDTDAVNVAQLKTVAVSLKVNGTAAPTTDDTYSNAGNLLIKRKANDDGSSTYDIKLNNSLDLTDGGKVQFGDANHALDASGLTLGDSVSLNASAPVGLKVGTSQLSDSALKVGGETYIDGNGLNANSKKITNVANATADADAVNLGQLTSLLATATETTGEVASGNTGIISGGTLYTEVRPAEDGKYVKKTNSTAVNLVALDTQVKQSVSYDSQAKTLFDKNSNATVAELAFEEGNAKTSISSEGVNVGSSSVVMNADGFLAGGSSFDTAKAAVKADGSVKAADGKFTVDTSGNVVSEGVVTAQGFNASGKKITNVAAAEVDTDAVNYGQLKSYLTNGSAAGGTVASDDTKLISGKTLYNEVRPADGNYIQQNATTAQNLAALDTQVKERVSYDSTAKTLFDKNSNAAVSELYFNKGAGNQVHISSEGIVVGTSSTLMNADGFTAGGHTYDEAPAALMSDGRLKAAGGSFTVSSDGSVRAAGGKFTVDTSGNAVSQGKVTAKGFDASGQKITNVAAGEADTDAVNVAQLKQATQATAQNDRRIQELAETDKKLSRRINRAGANAAALAALHPQDYDEDHKFSGAVGLGHYRGQQAIAVGMFARPSENLMFSLGSSIAGSKEVMVNAGVSYRFGAPNKLKTLSKAEMAGRINDLNVNNRDLTARLAASEAREANAQKRIAKLEADMAELMKMVAQKPAKAGKAAVRKVRYTK